MCREKIQILKNKNISILLEIIRKSQGISRVKLAQMTNQTPASITKITKKLLDYGFIIEEGLANSTGGRPAKIIRLNENMGNVISVYLAPNYIEVVLYSLNLEKLYEERLDLWMKTTDKVFDNVIKLIQRAQKTSKLEVLGIGVAVNGLVDSINGISLYSPHYRWINKELKNHLQDIFKVQVYIENDVRCMAIGEKNYGVTKNSENFVFINIGNGVGSALYLNNSIYSGANFGAGEIGHIPVEGSNSRCKCGRLGCLENVVSNEALEERFHELFEESLSANKIYESYASRNFKGSPLVEEVILYLVKSFVPIVNTLNPAYIILNGDINFGGEKVYKTIKSELSKRTFGRLNDILEIRGTQIGKYGVHMGCANLVFSSLFTH